MTNAYALNAMKKGYFYAGSAIDPEQGRKVTQGVSFRTVTTLLLSSTSAVFGDRPTASRRPSLAGLLNDVTRWHAA